MDAGQAWIWTLLPLFLHMINQTPATSLDLTDSLQTPTNFVSVENLALEENDPPLVPTYRLLTSAPAGQSSLLYPQPKEESTHLKQTSINKTKNMQTDTTGDFPNGDKTKLKTMNQSNSFKTAKKKDQLETPLSEEDANSNQRKINTTVSNDSGKTPDTSKMISDIYKPSKANNRSETYSDNKNEKYNPKNRDNEMKKNTTVFDISGTSSDALNNSSDSSKVNNQLEKPNNREDLESDVNINGVPATFSNQNAANTSSVDDQSERRTKNKNTKTSENDRANQLEYQGLKVKPLRDLPKTDLVRSNEMSDMIMDIDEEQPRTYWTAFSVQQKVRVMELRNSTENFMALFNKRYAQLPHEEADNVRWRKFLRAVVETFVLDFFRLYDRKPFILVGDRNQHHDKYVDELDYNETYNLALSHLREKKGQTAQQLAVPVKSAANALRVMLDVPVGIVQSKCKLYMRPWQCQAHYLSKLIDEAETCENIWYHADLHLKMLAMKYVGGDPTEIIIQELELKRKFVHSKKASYLFDFILHVIKGLKSRLRDSLITNAVMYNDIKKMQHKGLLGCVKIEQVLSTLNYG